MDDPVFKSKYQKYKYKVKLWEKSFRQINGRIPSKHDIREAPLNIRDAYKMYFKLKSSFLEDTLNDVLDEDGFDLSLADSSQLDASVANSSALSDYYAADGGTEGAPSLPTLGDISAATTNAARGSLETSANTTAGSSGSGPSFSNIDELPPMALSNLRNVDENHVLTEFEAEEHENADIVAMNAKAWGTHLNRSSALAASSSEPKKVATSQEAVRKVVTEKLFRNASFSKRNPRKSLSTRGIGAVAADGLLPGSQQRPQNLLPDLETILMEKARKQNEQELVQSVAPKQTGPATMAVATASNTLRAVVDQGWLNRCSAANGEVSGAGERSTTPAAQSQPVKFGMSNLNVPLLQPAADSAATVGPSVKETYAQNTYADELLYGDDYEEVIENSEDEGTASAKATSTRHVLKKRKVHDFRPIAVVTVAKAEEETPIVSDATTENHSARGIKKVDEKTPRPKAAKRTVKLKTSPKLTSTPSVSVVRRSTRAVRRCVAIPATAETDGAVVDDDDFEADATDSDADPEFNPSTDGKKGNRDTPLAASDSSSDDEKENPSKTSRKSSLKTATVNRKSAAPGKHKPTDIVDGADEAEADGPQDYVLEFGTDYTVSVPRVDVAELQANTEAFQDYVYDINPTKSAAQSRNDAIHIPLTKREMERAKLETRIEAGKLNENFVRINIQKKKFVRGHKTTNFSKYKKSEWRKIKVANALAGPEMNMNGCDGGFLLCFQCGQQGHFASDCKMQSDRLLPLSADVEVSEFPTLAEVERMADEKRLRAYERRPAAQASADEHAEQQTESDEADDDGDRDENELTAGAQKSATAGGQTANFLGHQIPAEFLKLAGYDADTVANSDAIRPLYDLDADGNVRPPTDEVLAALRQFGHTSFRKGQDRAVMRVLSGQPTLVTLSTGSGKSLCYQLPAYMYRQQRRQCITLVISPLVSLMEDQVHDVPHFLNAQCLHTGQTKAVRERIMAAIRSGVVDVLLISPEAVVAGERATGFGSLLRELPPIAFACIDEAHCMSQWSHNFRPSYLMICRVLQEKLKVHTVLGLTATATRTTRESIVRHLAIPDGMRGVISDVPLPGNLLLTVSSEANRDQGLVRLLRSEQFAAFRSIIVYCTRRDECERVAGVIRMCFQDEEKQLREDSAAAALAAGGGATKKRMRTKSLVECYHAGLAASRRKKIQNEFMRSDLKIVVATIAFGMGINKADIRAVIHYNMPMTYENYTQEVGRAGRDGQPSHCHLFLDSNKKDLVELRRHVYANSIDRHVIRKLLQKVFVSCACEHNLQLKEYQSEVDAVQNMSWTDDMHDDDADVENKTTAARPLAVATAPTHVRRKCPGHENCFSVEKTVQALDIPEENIATLLCYLELHEQRYIQVLSRAYCVCKVMSYGGAGVLKAAARTCIPLAMAIALDLKRGISHHQSTLIQFQVVDVAAAIGWDSGIVKHQLKNLEWTNVNGQPKRSSISIEFSDLGFRVRSPGDLSDAELDTMLDMMYGRVTGQERMQLLQLQNVFNGLSAVAFDSCALAIKQPEEEDRRSDKLKVHIRDYFQRDGIDETIEIVELKDTKEVTDDQIENDVRTMMARYPDNQFTGRTLARIFHGVASPVYPAQIWFRCNFWRTHTRVDFNRIVTLANAVIVRCRRS